MKKLLLLILVVCFSKISYADWVDLNTGINDDLTGVVFWANNGLVSGHHGIYYTTSGGNGPASWTRFNIVGNSSDSILYNNTKFKHAFVDKIGGSNTAYACGYDSVAYKAVVMKFTLPAMTYTVMYVGTINTRLNNITYNSWANSYYAVGDNGLIVKLDGSGNPIISVPFNYNLTSISFVSNNFSIGSYGYLINGVNNSSSNVFTYNISNTPTDYYTSVICTGYNYNYAVGNSYYKSIGNGPNNQPNFDFGPLNANTMINYSSSNHFVGTDHGIFKSSSTYSFLEWQPSSLNYNIQAFWNGSSSNIYACGKNGVLLYTNDGGGVTKPVAKFNLMGGCVGSSLSISGITGTSTNCKWYINNVLSSSACGSFNHTFNTVGQYTVEVDVANSSNLYDTAIQVINIVNLPNINKPVSLSKNTLCHQESIAVSIDSSQQNVTYSLKKIGSIPAYGTSAVGTQSTITFASNVLSVAGNYYLQANSSIAFCSKNFTDTIKIGVEKTKADFHSALINATPGENVNLYQQCTDAQNFAWSFPNDANVTSSSNANPVVNFSSVGQKQVKLISWSNNGCYDSIEKQAVTIYNEPLIDDSCWTNINNGSYSQYFSHGGYPIFQMSSSKTGYITCGTYFKESFASRYGDSLKLMPVDVGAYVAKYNEQGVIKWIDYSLQHDINEWDDLISSVAEDKDGNIYACGYSTNFFDTRGDSTTIGSGIHAFNNSNFLIKLDSTGKVVWRFVPYGLAPKKVFVDNANNVYIIGTSGLIPSVSTYSVTGTQTYTYSNIQTPSTYQMMKISPSGQLKWLNSFDLSYGEVEKITFDQNNNLYVTGVYEYFMKWYIAPSSVLTSTISNNGLTNIFIAKYDTTGVLQWRIHAENASPFDITTDSIGNSYVSGEGIPIFKNTDGTLTTSNPSAHFISKINANGICKWIQGSTSLLISGSWRGGVNEEGNEISLIGYLSDGTSNSLSTDVFTSSNNINAALTISSNDYFIAFYDTLGNLKRILTNGSNQNSFSHNEYFNGFFKRKNSNEFYFGRNIRHFYPYDNFGDILPVMNGYHASVCKFTENCGIITYPNLVTGSPNVKSSVFSIHPNPTPNLVHIEGLDNEEKLSVKLVSITGQQLPGKYNNGTISLENLSPGMYFLLIYKDNKLVHQEKIIKE